MDCKKEEKSNNSPSYRYAAINKIPQEKPGSILSPTLLCTTFTRLPPPPPGIRAYFSLSNVQYSSEDETIDPKTYKNLGKCQMYLISHQLRVENRGEKSIKDIIKLHPQTIQRNLSLQTEINQERAKAENIQNMRERIKNRTFPKRSNLGIFSVGPLQYVTHPQLQSTCHYIIVKSLCKKNGTFVWGGGGGDRTQTEKIPTWIIKHKKPCSKVQQDHCNC